MNCVLFSQLEAHQKGIRCFFASLAQEAKWVFGLLRPEFVLRKKANKPFLFVIRFQESEREKRKNCGFGESALLKSSASEGRRLPLRAGTTGGPREP